MLIDPVFELVSRDLKLTEQLGLKVIKAGMKLKTRILTISMFS